MTGRDFIFTGLQPWDLPIGSNARDIALEVSLQNRVLYVNTPLIKWSGELQSDKPELSRRIKTLRGQTDPLRRINDNLWVLDLPLTVYPVNKLPDGLLFDIANRFNNSIICRFIRKQAEALGFHRTIHFIDNDIYRSFYTKEYLRPALSVYYRRDNVLAIDYWRRHAVRLEPLLIAKSDLVVCNSAYLAQVARAFNPHTFDIGQGLDLTAYKTSDNLLPEDMTHIPRPIIGYMGHITSLRLDAELLYDLAQRNPSRSFVLVGSMDRTFQEHSLQNLPNVYFLGSKSPTEVPRYINSFDICINPQAINDATIGNYPRKIDEYLSLGKPVVATRTQTMQLFGDYVRLCASAEEYRQAIDDILCGNDGPSAEARIRFAHTHSWEASVEALYRAIEKTEKR